MDDFNDMFSEDNFSEIYYNKMSGSLVPDLIEYLAENLNMIVAVSRTESNLLERIEFFIKPPQDGSNGSDDGDGGQPTHPKPLPPKRPVEIELEA
jgi:hypothetical protein